MIDEVLLLFLYWSGGVPGIGKTQLGYNLAVTFYLIILFLCVSYRFVYTIYRIQLAVNIQIPYDYGGLGGKAIYIGKFYIPYDCFLLAHIIIMLYLTYSLLMLDTEGSFMVERALQIAEACGDDMAEYSRLYHKGSQACEVKKQPKDFLENIFYFRVCSYTEQIALINYLDKFIEEHKDVRTDTHLNLFLSLMHVFY